jgi:hypothetical protein
MLSKWENTRAFCWRQDKHGSPMGVESIDLFYGLAPFFSSRLWLSCHKVSSTASMWSCLWAPSSKTPSQWVGAPSLTTPVVTQASPRAWKHLGWPFSSPVPTQSPNPHWLKSVWSSYYWTSGKAITVFGTLLFFKWVLCLGFRLPFSFVIKSIVSSFLFQPWKIDGCQSTTNQMAAEASSKGIGVTKKYFLCFLYLSSSFLGTPSAPHCSEVTPTQKPTIKFPPTTWKCASYLQLIVLYG